MWLVKTQVLCAPADTVCMNPDLTICPVLLARDLAGTYGHERARRLNLWITAFTVAVVACGNDTTLVLNGSASVMWLKDQRALAFSTN